MICTACGVELASTHLRPGNTNGVFSDLFYCATAGCEREGVAAYAKVNPDVPVQVYKQELYRMLGKDPRSQAAPLS